MADKKLNTTSKQKKKCTHNTLADSNKYNDDILNLCDSLLETLYHNTTANNNNNDDDTDNDDKNNDNNDKDLINFWKEYRNNPQMVLDMAVKKMSQDQLTFFNQITTPSDTKIYMLSGLPGTGKSYLQQCINLHFRLKGEHVICLAPTNLIAYQQKGQTIHSNIKDICRSCKMSVFNCDNIFMEKLLTSYNDDKEKVKNLPLSSLCSFIKRKLLYYTNEYYPITGPSSSTILLDEGTMVSSTLFAMLYASHPEAKYLITYGPNQLQPPGKNATSCDVCIRNEVAENDKSIVFYELVSQMRLANDCVFVEFIQYFSDILSGKNDVFTSEIEKLDKMEYFFKNIRIGGTIDDYYHNLSDEKKILIVSTNAQRCKENSRRLKEEGEGPIFSIHTELDDKLPDGYDTQSRLGIDKILQIRKNVYCIIRINDLNKELIKGQIVKIVDICVKNNEVTSIKVVRINDEKNKVLELEKTSIKTDYCIYNNNDDDDDNDDDNKYCFIKQFPITLSYSLTAHSAQGKTLNCNIGIHLQRNQYNSESILNSYFVAISRVRNSKQLFMDSHPVCWLYPTMNITCVEDVQNYRQRLFQSEKYADFYVNNFSMKPIKNITNMKNVDEIVDKIIKE